MRFRGLVFRPRLPPPQMVEANVRYDPVQPRVETAFEPKPVQIPENFQKGFLVNVPSVFGALHQVQCQPQHVSIVPANQFLERRSASGLRLFDDNPFLCFGWDVTEAKAESELLV